MTPAIRTAATLHRQGRLAEAEAHYRSALAQTPDLFDALHFLGVLKLQQGQPSEAHDLIAKAVEIQPASLDARSNLVAALLTLERPAEAIRHCDQILAASPQDATTLYNRGTALAELEQHGGALDDFDAALSIKPDHINALFNRARLLARQMRCGEALADLDKLLKLVPQQQGDASVLRLILPAHLMRGFALAKLNRPLEAAKSYEYVLANQPDQVEALAGYSFVLNLLHRHEESLAVCERALALAPTHIDVLLNCSVAQFRLGLFLESIASCDRILSMQPNHVDAQYNRAVALSKLRRFDEAIACCKTILSIDPDHAHALGTQARACLSLCDWAEAPEMESRLMERLASGRLNIPPLILLGYTPDPEASLKCAQSRLAHHVPARACLPPRLPTPGGKVIRLAYVSADFRDHPVAYLAAGLFERHDRERFEVIGVSFGPNDKGKMRARLERAFDRFFEVSARPDAEVAALLHQLEVDIAVDLNGHTQAARLGIFAHRPAPIQVTYLGYPGTTGADFIDYLIGDPIVVPTDQQRFYSERLVYLPDSYLVNDSGREIASAMPSREQLGLPEDGFVFCCFNGAWKITASMFDIWMRLLREVDSSVLWLSDRSELATNNLRAQAQARGISPERLVFARFTDDPADHLARLQHADLFLDTLPYNAHTTACDALWAGVPVLTCRGTSFAGKVGASVLHAVGLPELITEHPSDYENAALMLARDKSRLQTIRRKLSESRKSCPLFDTDRFRRNIEAAYTTMWEIWRRGESPRSFSVGPT
jgi:predicted O-linked N-acetylglucosamine transferase (SPINDLY family)